MDFRSVILEKANERYTMHVFARFVFSFGNFYGMSSELSRGAAYRRELAERLTQEPDRVKRRTLLSEARKTDAHDQAFEEHFAKRALTREEKREAEQAAERKKARAEQLRQREQFFQTTDRICSEISEEISRAKRITHAFFDCFADQERNAQPPESTAALQKVVDQLWASEERGEAFFSSVSHTLQDAYAVEDSAARTLQAVREEQKTLQPQLDAAREAYRKERHGWTKVLASFFSGKKAPDTEAEILRLEKKQQALRARERELDELQRKAARELVGPLEQKVIWRLQEDVYRGMTVKVRASVQQLWNTVRENPLLVDAMCEEYVWSRALSEITTANLSSDQKSELSRALSERYQEEGIPGVREALHAMKDIPESIQQGMLRKMSPNADREIRGGAERIIPSLVTGLAYAKTLEGQQAWAAERARVAAPGTGSEKDPFERAQSKLARSLYFPDLTLDMPDGLPMYVRVPDYARSAMGTFRESPTLTRVFGEGLGTLWREERDGLVKEVLRGNSYNLNLLRHFSSPEVARVLLLQSQDALLSPSDREIAIESLRFQAQKPEWEKTMALLFQGQPELLEHIDALRQAIVSKDGERREVLTHSVNALALAALRDEDISPEWRKISIQALSSEVLVRSVAEENAVSPDDLSLLERALRKFPAASGEGNTRYAQTIHEVLANVLEKRMNYRAKARKNDAMIKNEAPDLRTQVSDLHGYALLANEMLGAADPASAARYLFSREVLLAVRNMSRARMDKESAPVPLEAFLAAYKKIPTLPGHPGLFNVFTEKIKSPEAIDQFQSFVTACEERGVSSSAEAGALAMAVCEGNLEASRAIALLLGVRTKQGGFHLKSLRGSFWNVSFETAEYFLQEDDGLDVAATLNDPTKGLDGLSPAMDASAGKAVLGLKENKRTLLFDVLSRHESRDRVSDVLAHMEAGGNVSEVQAKALLFGYVSTFLHDLELFPGAKAKMERFLSEPGAKDLLLSALRTPWRSYLEGGKKGEVPLSLQAFCSKIAAAGEVGPLRQVDIMSSMVDAYSAMLRRPQTAERTKGAVFAGLADAEARFAKERWSNEDIADFYAVARDILSAAPSLFAEYFSAFSTLKPKEFKEFARNIFPMHRALLALSGTGGKDGTTVFAPRELARIRQYVSSLSAEEGRAAAFATQKEELTDRITARFQKKFGITKVSEQFTESHIQAMSGISMYLSNLRDRNPQKENILGYFLALHVNDAWSQFRRGEAVDPGSMMTAEKAKELQEYLERRRALDPVTAKRLHIPEGRLSEFQGMLQEDEEVLSLANIETIDAKLQSTLSNLRGLLDLDLYPDPLDKERMKLLEAYGNKTVGAVAAKMFLEASGKQVSWTENETNVRRAMESVLQVQGLSASKETVKKVFQDEMKPLAMVVNTLQSAEALGVDQEIHKLQTLLRPSEDVVAVFRRMGESFAETSGAVAVAQDLDYLDNMLGKKGGELSDADRQTVTAYLSGIREELARLESIWDTLQKKVVNMKQSQAETKNALLRAKMEEISRVMQRTEGARAVVSSMTNNLPYLIRNMRECLSCVRQGVNNDTNLTFGDTNKFYLSSRSEERVGTISDEIVFFEPIVRRSGEQNMAFVLDRVYGNTTSAILQNQVQTVYKKLARLSERFPEAPLSLFVTEASAKTCGISLELLGERLTAALGASAEVRNAEEVSIDVVASASGDHYVEFGGSARNAGVRTSNGIVIQKKR